MKCLAFSLITLIKSYIFFKNVYTRRQMLKTRHEKLLFKTNWFETRVF